MLCILVPHGSSLSSAPSLTVFVFKKKIMKFNASF